MWRFDQLVRLQQFRSSEEWRTRRRQILRRDGYCCRECLRRHVQLDVHHVLPLLEYWERRLDPYNLETLCHECHQIRHGRCFGGTDHPQQLKLDL